MQNISFTGNLAKQYGDDIFSENSKESVQIRDSSFTSPNAKNSLYLDTSTLILLDSYFTDIYGNLD